MNELTYGDVIRHYERKLLECNEEIDALKARFAELDELERAAWKGGSAEAFLDKLCEMRELLARISQDLERCAVRLETIGSGCA